MSRALQLLDRLLFEVGEVKRTIANMIVIGPVADRDPEKGYRVAIGPAVNGTVPLSPWMPHPDSGGENADWRPLSLGQIVMAVNPAGDWQQGALLRAGFGGGKAPPSKDLDEVVLLDGACRIFVKAGTLTVACDGETLTFGPDGLRHNGVQIGRAHHHTEVVKGLDTSGPPEG